MPLQVHYYSEALLITALILYQSKHAEAPQATANEALAQGPYVAAGAGFESVTFQTQGTKLTTEPPGPTNNKEYRVCTTHLHVNQFSEWLSHGSLSYLSC